MIEYDQFDWFSILGTNWILISIVEPIVMRDHFKTPRLLLYYNTTIRLDNCILSLKLTNRNLLFNIRANEIARQELLPDHSRFMLKTCLERL